MATRIRGSARRITLRRRHVKKIRVFLVDDHTVLRQAVRVMLEAEEDIEIAGEAGDGAEAVREKEIASVLSISEETVKTHLKRLYEKLGAADRAQAVAIALRRNLIE